MNKQRLRLAEFAIWVSAVAASCVAVALAVGLAIGSLIVTKYMLFVLGALLAGIGFIGIQPKRPHRDEKRISVESDSPTRMERAIQQVPPLDDSPLRFDERISRHPKLITAGLVVLCISFVFEAVFGVTVAS